NYAAGWASIDLLLATKDKAVVLVVDDNFDLVHFYKRYVEGTGYEVIHASEGSQVWSLVKQRPPDLIVLDVMLPDINGWHLLHELHQHPATLQIPIVICSVIDQAALAHSLGAAAYLAKPVHRQAFIQTLDHVRLRH
ncbi:MAG: response regulator, partial [Anaerolineales bacterium]|nr:response regulator [Anaerolineales bacterium]